MAVSVYSVAVNSLQHRQNSTYRIWNKLPETHHPIECVRTNSRFSFEKKKKEIFKLQLKFLTVNYWLDSLSSQV